MTQKMTIVIVMAAILLPFSNGLAQTSLEELDPPEYFDFWVGTWNLTWENSSGEVGHGTNTIEKILDGKVIQENFEATEGQLKGFKGKSFSVYHPQRKKWQQTWVDNNGGYLDFKADFDGNKRIFYRNATTPDGNPMIQRMVFYDITEKTFIWDWEISTDEGKTWQLRWRIEYERM